MQNLILYGSRAISQKIHRAEGPGIHSKAETGNVIRTLEKSTYTAGNHITS